jgi:hypothetical protein
MELVEAREHNNNLFEVHSDPYPEVLQHGWLKFIRNGPMNLNAI